MSITKEEHEDLTRLADEIEERFNEFKMIVRRGDDNLFERWKAYGFHVTDDFVGDHPTMRSVVESIVVEEDEDDHEEVE